MEVLNLFSEKGKDLKSDSNTSFVIEGSTPIAENPSSFDPNNFNFFFERGDIDRIRIDENPTTESWRFEPLYRLDTNNNMRLWQVGFDFPERKIRTRTGLVRTGNFTPSDIDVVENKSGRNLQEQAMLEARRKYMDKYIEELYRPAGMETPMMIKPARGNEYEEKKVKKWPIATQVKIDGQRMLFNEENGKINLRSKSNRSMNYITHLNDELTALIRYLPAGSIGDGELYNHNYSFEQLRSIISTNKNGTHPLLPTIEYYIFDIYYPENPPYEIRYNTLLRAYKKFLEDGYKNTKFFILACSLAKCHDDIEKYHEIYVSKGYEGLIARKLAGENPTEKDLFESSYRDTKTNNILKFKKFFEEEGTIIDVYEGNGREKGAAIFMVQDSQGHVFGVHPRGQIDMRKQWFNEPKTKFIGRLYTFRYFERTEYGIPRFPTGISFRDFLE